MAQFLRVRLIFRVSSLQSFSHCEGLRGVMGDTALACIIHAYLSYINIQDKYQDFKSHYTKGYREAAQKEIHPQSGIYSLNAVCILLTFAVSLPSC